MKNYKEILAEIAAVWAEIEELKTEKKNIRCELDNLLNGYSAKNMREAFKMASLDAQYVALETRKDEVEQKMENLDMIVKVLKSNAEIAFYAEIIPTVVEVFGKYAGKRVGEKTERKIRDEVTEKTGVNFYYTCGYSTKWHLHTKGVEITVYFAYDCGMWDKDGKLNAITEDMLLKPSESYIENPVEYIEEIKAAAAEIAAKEKELNELVEKYNHKAVGNIEHFQYVRLR